jgi:YbgC/YbaW family acyl-CoA thioester hydrolase
MAKGTTGLKAEEAKGRADDALDWQALEDAAKPTIAETPEPAHRDGFRFRHRLQVRFSDCDPMRHANHAVYLTFCEQARFAYWRRLAGVAAHETRSFIIVRSECDYRSSALPGEGLDVWLRVDSIGRSSFAMCYEIVSCEDDRLVASARTVQVMFDYAANKPFPVPDWLAAALEAFEGHSLRRS